MKVPSCNLFKTSLPRWPSLVLLIVCCLPLGPGGAAMCQDQPRASEKGQRKLRDGFFGISNIVDNKAYLDDLGVQIFRYGFFMPISEEAAQHGRPLHDETMKASVEHGSTPMITIWAVETKPESQEWTRGVVRYYTTGEGAQKIGTAVKYWEIGNEVNWGWRTKCDADEYYKRVSVYSSGIKEVCPDCKVIIGGLVDNAPGPFDLEAYLDRFLQLGGGKFIDVYNFHYYGNAKPVGNHEYYLSGVTLYNSIKGILKKYGFQGRPVWITETSTFSGKVGNLIQTEEEQAADLVKRFAVLKAVGLEKVLWCFIEEKDFEGKTDEGFFDQSGLIFDGRGPGDKGKGVKKKSYFAYKEMAARLGDAVPVRLQSDDLTYLAVFSTVSGKASVVWQDKWKGDREIAIKGKETLEVRSIYGEKQASGKKKVRLTLGVEPVYVLGEVSRYEYTSKKVKARSDE